MKTETQKATFTPGPWEHYYIARGKYHGSVGVTRGQADPAFAILPAGQKEIQEANLRLICAAPQMLEILRLALCSASHSYMCEAKEQKGFAECDCWRKTAHQIIAQVEG